jgi:CubicO group peptidase (beta-lactamase class C family)
VLWDGLDEWCESALSSHGCASVSLAVAERGDVVLARAYGAADVAARRPATPATVYGLASITKALTATAVCLAADDGLLDLDGPAPGDYPWPAPTPRQLLRHRGGFPAFYAFHYDAGPMPIDVDRYRTLVRAPDTDFEYSNLGYRELGRLLEAVTGTVGWAPTSSILACCAPSDPAPHRRTHPVTPDRLGPWRSYSLGVWCCRAARVWGP